MKYPTGCARFQRNENWVPGGLRRIFRTEQIFAALVVAVFAGGIMLVGFPWAV